MTLLNPTALFWTALSLPILALYILRIRRRRQVVPTLIFWDQIFHDTRPRSLWRQLRHWLSLLLQLGFAALVIAALTEPVPSGAARKPVHYLLVLDESASMQATDGAPTRFAEAQQKAHALVRSMRDLDQCTIIGAAVQPIIACGRTYHQPTLHATIDQLAPMDAPANLEAAVALARAVNVGDPQREVVVLTDAGGARGLASAQDRSARVLTCGRDTGNLAITAFGVRPRTDNPVELQGMLKVANYSERESEVQVRLKLDDQLHDIVVLKLAPGEERLRSFSLINRGAKLLRAELVGDDALDVDNRSLAVLPSVHTNHVTLVTAGNLFLESVIASHPWMQLTTVKPEQADAAVASADIVVYDRVVPAELPHKPTLYVFPEKDSKLWTLKGELKSPLVSDLAKDSDLLRHVSLQNVTFHLARAIATKTPALAVMSSFENPLLLRWAVASPPVILLAVDINQSDLPWRTAFPILMENALNDLAGQSTEQPSAYHTGQAAQTRLEAAAVTAHDAHGHALPVVDSAGLLTLGPVVTAGLATVEGGKDARPFAFNLASADESNLHADAHAAASQPAASQAAEATAVASWSLPWWVWLSIVALGLSTVEWCLHQRRVVD